MLHKLNSLVFESNIAKIPVNTDRIKILKLEDGKKVTVVTNYVMIKEGCETICMFKYGIEVDNKLKYTSISHRFKESYTRNMVLSFTYRHVTHRAKIFYCDEDDMFKLADQENDNVYLTPTEFRDYYVTSDRNGQQISNISVLLDDSHVGRYTNYSSFQSLYSKVMSENHE